MCMNITRQTMIATEVLAVKDTGPYASLTSSYWVTCIPTNSTNILNDFCMYLLFGITRELQWDWGRGGDGNNTFPYGNCDHHLCTAWVCGFLWLCLIKLWSEYTRLHDSFDCLV